MKFEIINPSDACTMYAPDLEVAAVAVSFLGDGKYPLEGLDDAAGQGVPAFLFGGHDEWFSSKFGMSFQDTAEHVLNHRNEELATTLDSVTLRHTRSSMNDIAGRARSLAQAVRRKVSSNAAATEIEMAETNYEHEIERAEEELTRLAGNWKADEEARASAQDALNNSYQPGISPEAWAEAAYLAVWGVK